MFLKSVPPAVAIHSDWRSVGVGPVVVSSVVGGGGGGGTPQSLGLPLCFNDSDSSLSNSGTPIHKKVQMIIDTLRTSQSQSQSSVDMSDGGKTEGTTGSAAATAHCSRELLWQTGRKATKGPGPGPVPTGSKGGAAVPAVIDCPRPPSLHPTLSNPESQDSDSDSDSSVDRGIEEAIQEYLKERVDHKRKAEPASVSSSTSPAAKLPCREPVVKAEQPRLLQSSCSDNNKVLTASNHILKASKGNANSAAIQLKKKLKKKRPSKENPVKKQAVTMLSFFKRLPPRDQRQVSSSALPYQDEAQTPSHVIKDEPLDNDSSSSSDDGIEEEIRRYQQQKNMELFQLSWSQQARKEESDSSSDDGIEEAIRRFQQEKKQKEQIRQKKKKSAAKRFQELKNNYTSEHGKIGHLNTDRAEVPSSSSSSGKKVSKPVTPESTNKRKKVKPRLMGKVSVPRFSSERRTSFSGPPSDSLNGKGHTIPSCKAEPTPVPILKANTTAELMCAEAILDISKAVMPMTFDLSPHALGPMPLVPSTGPSLSKDPSDAESSVDSEDGIELEIRKFLEQKAQMKEQTTLTSVPATAQKLSKAFQPIPPPPAESEKGDHSDVKSSSLDSDEDLDAAIKDLLKTKKRIKRKAKKPATKPTGSSPTATTTTPTPTTITTNPSKKQKVLTETSVKSATAKSGLPKVIKKKPSQMKNKKAHKSSGNGSQDKKQKKKTKPKTPGQQQTKPQLEDKGDSGGSIALCIPDPITVKEQEEDSSVDSDDSIEQEIRKFLAEKAKVGGGGGSSNVSLTTTSSTNNTDGLLTEKTEEMETEVTHLDQQRSSASPTRPSSSMEDQQAEIPLDVGRPCLQAQQGVWQKPESGRESRETVGNISWDRLPQHTPLTTSKGERKGSFEDRHPPHVDALQSQRDKPHPHFGCDTPSSRPHTSFTHTPSRTHTSAKHTPNRTLTPNSQNEITPCSPSTPCPPYVRTNSPATTTTTTTSGLSGLSDSSCPSVVDSCSRSTKPALPVVTFYRSSAKTPIREGGHQTPYIITPDSQSQGSGMKRGRWDQPAPTQTPQRSSSSSGGSSSTLHSTQQQASHSQSGYRQDREGKEERPRAILQTEVRKVKQQQEKKEEKEVKEEEFIDETDMDSEEERRQSKSRQQRFPCVSLGCSLDPGTVPKHYIILSTEERNRMVNKTKRPRTCKKKVLGKRKLQFVSCPIRV